MTTPALRAAALGMARLYCNDARAERLAMFLEEHAQAAFVAFAPLIADVRAAERERCAKLVPRYCQCHGRPMLLDAIRGDS